METCTKKKLRVAAYCRVSTDQEEQAGSFQNQVQTYQQMIQGNPDWEFAGIYADEGISGTRVERRTGFLRMMNDCRAGKIDRILTKSISRFARNVVDSLNYIRELRVIGVGVYFEEERLLSTDHGAELIFTILSAMAEQESRNISEHTKWGIRSRFRQGIYKDPVTLRLYGFVRDASGKVAINEEEAKTIRLIYRSFLEGMTFNGIAASLNEFGVSFKDRSKWSSSRIRSLLTNEKYVGDVILQKSYAKDFIKHQSVVNHGEVQQYRLRNVHPAIIEREQWDAVQLEIKRRMELTDPFGQSIAMNEKNPYSGKVFYRNDCKALLSRILYESKHYRGGTWKCRWTRREYRPACHNPNRQHMGSDIPPCQAFSINHEAVRQFFLTAWNDMICDGLQERRERWNSVAHDGVRNALEKVRAQQMLELTSEGVEASKLKDDIPEIVRMVLKQIEIQEPRYAKVTFLDGTEQDVDLKTEWISPKTQRRLQDGNY